MKLTNRLRVTANKTSNILTKALLKEAAEKIEILEADKQRLLDQVNANSGLNS